MKVKRNATGVVLRLSDAELARFGAAIRRAPCWVAACDERGQRMLASLAGVVEGVLGEPTVEFTHGEREGDVYRAAVRAVARPGPAVRL